MKIGLSSRSARPTAQTLQPTPQHPHPPPPQTPTLKLTTPTPTPNTDTGPDLDFKPSSPRTQHTQPRHVLSFEDELICHLPI